MNRPRLVRKYTGPEYRLTVYDAQRSESPSRRDLLWILAAVEDGEEREVAGGTVIGVTQDPEKEADLDQGVWVVLNGTAEHLLEEARNPTAPVPPEVTPRMVEKVRAWCQRTGDALAQHAALLEARVRGDSEETF